MSLPLIFIVTFSDFHRHFLSPSSSFYSPTSSFPFIFIVTSSHLHRHFNLVSSLLPLIFLDPSIHLHRQFYSPSASLSFTIIVFFLFDCHLQSNYYSSLSVSCTSKEMESRQDRPSSTSQELGATQDKNHLQHHKNLKANKTQTIFSIIRTGSQTRDKPSSVSQQLVWTQTQHHQNWYGPRHSIIRTGMDPDTASSELVWTQTQHHQNWYGPRHSIIRTGIKTDKQSLAASFVPLPRCGFRARLNNTESTVYDRRHLHRLSNNIRKLPSS